MGIVDSNRLIDVFMESKGIEIPVYNQYGDRIDNHCKPNSYHSDWNLLMGVVEKIESLEYYVKIDKLVTFIDADDDNSSFKKITSISENSKREAVYNAVVSFIKWYLNKE